MANEIYNTSWWGTALDTARTAGTNPDFFGSQFKLLTSEQDNIVVNGNFATDSDWLLGGGGFDISNGKLNLTNGLLYAASARNSQDVVSGKTYLVEYTISDYVSGSSQIRLGGQFGTSRNSNGTFSEYIVADSTFIRLYPSSNNTTLSIDNVSVQLVRCDLDQIEAKKCLADWIHTTALKDLNN